jgi:hypothetical protein
LSKKQGQEGERQNPKLTLQDVSDLSWFQLLGPKESGKRKDQKKSPKLENRNNQKKGKASDPTSSFS